MTASMVRLIAFLVVFIGCALFEFLLPRRVPAESRAYRWAINISLHLINALLVYFLMGAVLYTMATFIKEEGWGILNQLHAPQFLSILLTILFLDFVIYLQHRFFHYLPLFWRFHRVHHTDLDFDVSTGIRFHPIEIIVSLIIKMAAISLIGADPLGTVVFEIILNASSLFNHSNIFIPVSLDKKLRSVLVTPDVHRVHHSVSPNETNSNFGFSVTWWDRLCGTYRGQPMRSHTEMEIGLPAYRNPKKLKLIHLLALPALKSD